MKYSEMSDTLKRRFRKDHFCAVCNCYIFNCDDIAYSVGKEGRCKFYTFYHSQCIERGGVQIGKAQKESASGISSQA